MRGPIISCGKIEDKELRLIPLEPAHLELLIAWLADTEVTQYLNSLFPYSLKYEQAWYDRSSESKEDVVWGIEYDGTLIGVAGVHSIKAIARTAVTGMMIGDKAHWRKGIASAVTHARAQFAFEKLNLLCLFTEIFTANIGSLKAAEKAGYRQYGIKPFAGFEKGAHLEAWLGALTPETLRTAD